ncbi:RadC family protein [Brevundimonas sp.]|uniref:RadC family protein n=1 Tax=Brevundimonas sp. TaxID=1871086 RepID=UPI003A92723F
MTAVVPPPASKPHHLGHRERLRERARAAGLSHLPDYELLELFLFRSLPRGDVKPIAKTLLARFGSLAAVLAAPVEAIVAVKAEDSRGKRTGLGVETALDLTALHEVARRIALEEPAKRPVISSWTALLAYVRLALQHEPREQFRALYLDNRNQLILDEIQNRGTVDHAPVYPREVVRRALELSAKAMILVHNHPSGDPTPSRADIEMTRQVVTAAHALGLEVHDHLVVGREGVASFKQLGLM